MEKRSDPRIWREVKAGGRIFAFEEYWEEDDAGFCCPDFVWEMHTRLKVFEEAGLSDGGQGDNAAAAQGGEKTARRLERVFDFDSGQREKELTVESGKVRVVYCPNFAVRKTVCIDPETLAAVSESSEDIGVGERLI